MNAQGQFNTFEGGLNRDQSEDSVKPNQSRDALNARVFGPEANTLAIQNMRGDIVFFKIPEVPNHSIWQYCFQPDCALEPPEECVCGDYSISINITTTFPTGTVVTNFGANNCFPAIYYDLAADINTTSQVTGAPLHAYVKCNCLFIESLSQDGDITDIALISSTNITVPTFAVDSFGIQAGLHIIGHVNNHGKLIIFTTNDSSEIGGIGQIWRIDISQDGLPVGLVPGDYLPLTDLRVNNRLNFSRRWEIDKEATYEVGGECVERVRWTDWHMPYRVIDLGNPATGLIVVDPVTMNANPGVQFANFEYDFHGTGSIASGIWQYTHRYITQGGVRSAFGPISFRVDTIDRNFTLPYNEVFSDQIGVDSGKSNVMTFSGLDPRYSRIQIVGLHSSAYGTFPDAAYIVADLAYSSDSIQVTHSADNFIFGTILPEDVYRIPLDLSTVKNLMTVANRIVVSNVCESEDIRFVPEIVSFEWKRQPILLDEVTPSDSQYYGVPGTITGVDPVSGLDLVGDFQDYKGTKVAHTFVGYPRGMEKIRLGISYLLPNGRVTSTSHLGDFITPEIDPTPGSIGEICSTDGSHIYGYALGIDIIVDLTPLVGQIAGFAIVRAPIDHTILAQGYGQFIEAFYTQQPDVLNQPYPAPDEAAGYYFAPDGHILWIEGLSQWVTAGATCMDDAGLRNNFVPSVIGVCGTSISRISPNNTQADAENFLRFGDGENYFTKGRFCFYSPDVDFAFPNEWIDVTQIVPKFIMHSLVSGNTAIDGQYTGQNDYYNYYPNTPASFSTVPPDPNPIGQGQIRRLGEMNFLPGGFPANTIKEMKLFGDYAQGSFSDLSGPVNLAPPPYLGAAIILGATAPGPPRQYLTTEHPGRSQTLLIATDDANNITDWMPVAFIPAMSISHTGAILECLDRWKAHTDWENLTIFNLVRPNENQYGGDSCEAIAATQYIYTGHFQQVTECDEDAIYPCEVWGGTHIPTLYDRTTRMNFFNVDAWYERDPLGVGTPSNRQVKEIYQNGIVLPIETRVNVGLRRYSEPFIKLDYSTPQVFDNTKEEQFDYNDVHSYLEHTLLFAGYNQCVPECLNLCRPLVIQDSEVIIPGEEFDNGTVFLIANRQEADFQFGPINHMATMRDVGATGRIMYIFQDTAYGVIDVNERVVLSTGAGAETQAIIGTGKVLGPIQYRDTNVGAFHKHSFTNTGRRLFFWSRNRKAFCAVDANGLDFLSIRANMDSWFQKDPLLKALYELDNPLFLGGVSGGASFENNEIFVTAIGEENANNLFPNFVQGTFEDMTDPQLAAQFQFVPPVFGYSIFLDTVNPYQGLQFLRLDIATNFTPTAGIVWRHFTTATLLPNTVYQISAWVKLLDDADELDSGAELAIRFNTGDFADATVLNQVKWTKGGPVRQWVKISMTFKTGLTDLTGKFAFTISENTPLLREFEGSIGYDYIQLVTQAPNGWTLVYSDRDPVNAFMTFWTPTPRHYMMLPGNRMVTANYNYNGPSDTYLHFANPTQFNKWYDFPTPAPTYVRFLINKLSASMASMVMSHIELDVNHLWDYAEYMSNNQQKRNGSVVIYKSWANMVYPAFSPRLGKWVGAIPRVRQAFSVPFDGTAPGDMSPLYTGGPMKGEIVSVLLQCQTFDQRVMDKVLTWFHISKRNL